MDEINNEELAGSIGLCTAFDTVCNKVDFLREITELEADSSKVGVEICNIFLALNSVKISNTSCLTLLCLDNESHDSLSSGCSLALFAAVA